MDIPSVCKICLREDVGHELESILDTPMPRLYKQLTKVTLGPRAEEVCEICREELFHCLTLMICCITTEVLYSNIICNAGGNRVDHNNNVVKMHQCRVCLRADELIDTVVSREQQTIYNYLTTTSFDKPDMRPEIVCGHCNERLWIAYHIWIRCVQREIRYSNFCVVCSKHHYRWSTAL